MIVEPVKTGIVNPRRRSRQTKFNRAEQCYGFECISWISSLAKMSVCAVTILQKDSYVN